MTEIADRPELAKYLEDLKNRLQSAEATLLAKQAGRSFTERTVEIAYRLAIESINEGVLTLSADSLIIYANCAMGKLLKTPLELLRGTSTGLSAMRERATLAGGNMDVASAPGKGTVVTAQIPIG